MRIEFAKRNSEYPVGKIEWGAERTQTTIERYRIDCQEEGIAPPESAMLAAAEAWHCAALPLR